MLCRICNEKKLSKEFVYENLSELCKHPALFCMECALKAVDGKCPYKDCDVSVSSDNDQLEEYNYVLDSMYPDIATINYPEIEVHQHNNTSQQWVVSVVMLTGERLMIPVSKSTTVMKLKERIYQKNGIDVDKQKLVFNEKELEIFRLDGSLATLQDYGIYDNCTICLLIMLYSIPQHFTDVTFDLHWGYPYSSYSKNYSQRYCDYLDASCLVFRGMSHIETVDFNHTTSYMVPQLRHSGDVMDNHNKIGHHTINVNLQNVPSDITHLFFTLSAWSSPTIQHFPNPSLKFFETSNTNKDLCSTSFTHAATSQAVIMCSVSRKSGVWQIYSSGKLSSGNAMNYHPLISTIQQLISSGI